MGESPTDRTRASLLAKLRDSADRPGWSAAWERFYAAYAPMILRWCGRWGLQEADAEEVTSAVLLVLARRMEGFDYDPSLGFRRWLKTVVHNEVKAHFARLARRPADRAAGAGEADPLAGLADPRAAADDLAAELSDRRAVLAAAMAAARGRVEPQTWAAFTRTAVDGEGAAAVARDLGMTVVAVYKAKSRVLDLLREEAGRAAPEG